LRLVLGEKAVSEFHGGVGGCNLGGVDGAGDQHHGLAFEEQLFGFGPAGLPRVGQFLLDGQVAVEMPQRVAVRNGGRDERPVVRGLPQFLDANCGRSIWPAR